MVMDDLADADKASGEIQNLVTRKPVWNEEVGPYTLRVLIF